MAGSNEAEHALSQHPTRKQLREKWTEWVKPFAGSFLRDLGFTEPEYAQHKVLDDKKLDDNKQRTRSQTQQQQLQRKQQRSRCRPWLEMRDARGEPVCSAAV